MRRTHIVVGAGLGGAGGPVQRGLAEAGHDHVSYVSNPDAVAALCRHMHVDLLLLSLDEGDGDRLEVIEAIAPELRAGAPHLIVVTDGRDPSRLATAMRLGARDFLRRPVDRAEVAMRVGNCLAIGALQAELRARNHELQRTIRDRSHELTLARREVLGHLAVATEFRDDETGEHTERVGRTSAAIAAGFGLDPDLVRMMRVAAPLHDVGKIGIPDRILLKPGALTDQEWTVMRSHTQIGAAILSDSHVRELQLAEEIALSHHERWDGSGYPYGLSGVSIPIAARIVAIADVFDALTCARPYKEAWPLHRALAEIEAQRGRHFDATLVDAFMALDHASLLSPITDNRDPGHPTVQQALHALRQTTNLRPDGQPPAAEPSGDAEDTLVAESALDGAPVAEPKERRPIGV